MNANQKKRLEIKIGLWTLRENGQIDINTVYELADELDIEISKATAQRMAKKIAKEYGF